MKKIVLCLIVTSFLKIANAQEFEPTSPCQQNENVRAVVSATDSLQRLIKKMKTTLTGTQWSDFMNDVNNGIGLVAFDKCGIYSEFFKSEYSAIGSEMERTLNKLKRVLDPGSTLTVAELKIKMDEAFNCFFDDNSENSYNTLRVSAGYSPVERTAGGPCEIAARSCIREEKRQYNSALRECAGIAIGAAGLISGWWGAGAGLLCASNASNDYFDGFVVCLQNYCDCANCD